ncbi:MAG: hypothetical protein KGL39_48100, partial [Patescibacteria group bacterium]|nr:hypothetical protein [Patescibacteria group bacterium]
MPNLAMPSPAEIAAFYKQVADPELFTRHVLGHNHWRVPREIMRSVAVPRSRTAVKACHASSKTYTAADIAVWWVVNGGIAITTAPKWTQVKDVMWRQIHSTYKDAEERGFPLGGRLNLTEWRISEDCYAIGMATNQGVRFQGWHGLILVLLDEAPGVVAEIFEAIEGMRSGGDVRILALGNPTIATGTFFDAFGSKRSGWRTFTIDAFDTPNFDEIAKLAGYAHGVSDPAKIADPDAAVG